MARLVLLAKLFRASVSGKVMDRAMEVKIWVLALALNCGWLAQGSAYLMSNRKVALRFLPIVDL